MLRFSLYIMRESIVGTPRVGGLHKVENKTILDILMFVACKNPQGYQDHFTSSIAFYF